jgi:hypothetical protein
VVAELWSQGDVVTYNFSLPLSASRFAFQAVSNSHLARRKNGRLSPDARSASFAIRFRDRGIERTAEFPLTPHMIEQLAMEAAVRGVTIGKLIGELITAMLSKGLVPQVLDSTDPATDPMAGRAERS